MTAPDRNKITDAFSAELRDLVGKHIPLGLTPETAAAVLCVCAEAALDHLAWKPASVGWASEHIQKANLHLATFLPELPPS